LPAAQGHSKPVDWWAFGVLLFEMVVGYPPFYDADVTATYKKILAGRVGFPGHVSIACRDLIRRLLKARRAAASAGRVVWGPHMHACPVRGALGPPCARAAGGREPAAGLHGRRAHVWFQGTAWDAAAAYRLPPPIRCAWHGECGAPLPRCHAKSAAPCTSRRTGQELWMPACQRAYKLACSSYSCSGSA